MRADDWYGQNIAPHEDVMLRSAYRILGDVERAEDALQSAALTLWKRRRRLRRHSNPRAFVLRVCLDAAHDVLRRLIRRHRSERGPLPPEGTPHKGSGPFGRACENELRRTVLARIGELPRSQATAFLMRVMHGESYADIAGALGCAESTVRTHVERARKALRTHLKHFAPPDHEEGNQ